MVVRIPSIKENVSMVESFIENMGKKIEIAEAVYGDVWVSVTEAVNNAIGHGNKEDKNKKFTLKFEVWLFNLNIRYNGTIHNREIKNVYNLNIIILPSGMINFVIK